MPIAHVLRTAVLVAVVSVSAQPASAAEPTQPLRSLTQNDAPYFVFPHISRAGFGQVGDEASGTVTLRLQILDRFTREQAFDNGQVVYTIDGEAVSPPVGPPYEYQWNATTVADGTHALGAILVDGPPDMAFYRAIPTQIVVDNVPGAVLTPQWLPVIGTAVGLAPRVTAAVDWIHHDSGHNRVHAMPEPHPYRFVRPAHSYPDPLALIGFDNWVMESLTEGNTGLYGGKPIVYRNRNGHLITGTAYQQAGASTHGAEPHVLGYANPDGARNDNSVTPYSTYVPDPAGPGWVGVDIAGRVFKVSQSGTVTTIVGRTLDPDTVPYDPSDRNIPELAIEDLTVLVGSFENELAFRAPTDLAFDPRNSSVLYVADYLNHRIAKVDLSVTPPRVSTFAGTPGVEGYVDGPARFAQFAEPISIAMRNDGTLYVADEENKAIRVISPDGRTVSTLARNSDTAPLVPFAIRLDSQGDLIVAEDGTGVVQKVLTASGTVVPITTRSGCVAGWVWIDVDRKGNVGPKDDILLACSAGGGAWTWRISSDGSRVEVWPQGGGTLPAGGLRSVAEPGGHYAWAVAIDDEEARVVYHGYGGLGLRQVRLVQEGDPDISDYISRMHPVLGKGIQLIDTGTVPNFPLGSRPSFTALRGVTGHGYLGQIPNFDELARMTDAELAEYIQSGMGGSVPRPEFTGRDLDTLIYYVRMTSLQGVTEPVPTPEPQADGTAPVIENVQVRRIGPETLEVLWQTDEPTLGVVAFGTSERYHRWSEIETGYATNHRVLLEHVHSEKSVHLAVLAKDEAGNQTLTADRVFNEGITYAPTAQLIASSTTVISGQSVTLRWASTDATTCTASDGWSGDKGTYGQQGRGPLTQDTTLTLTCSGPGGSVTSSVNVAVLPAPPAPQLEFTASPTRVAPGATSTLTWRATNASRCTAINNWSGNVPVEGIAVTKPVNGTLIYSLVCNGPGGQAEKSVYVTSLTASPNPRGPARR